MSRGDSLDRRSDSISAKKSEKKAKRKAYEKALRKLQIELCHMQAWVKHKGLRVITNNLNVAAILSDNPDCEVIVAGGLVRSRDRGIIGEATVEFIRQFRVDIGLIGISGIEADGTLRDFDYREVKVARAVIEQSRQVWLVADHSKFNRPAMVQLARLNEIDAIYTDRPPPESFEPLLKDAGVACVVPQD